MKDCIKHIDKNSILHFGVNFILSAVGGLYGACAAAGASITKEWCDKQYGGHICIADIVFDLLGISTGLLLNYIVV